jgi:hypothetical protein
LASSGELFSKSRGKRRALVAIVAVLVLLALGVAAGLHYATRSIQERVLGALGPESEVREVKVGLHEVELLGVRVGAPRAGLRTRRCGPSAWCSRRSCARSSPIGWS